jgi:hypothetical protein
MPRLVNPSDVALEQLDQLLVGLTVFGKKLVDVVKNPRVHANKTSIEQLLLGMPATDLILTRSWR